MATELPPPTTAAEPTAAAGEKRPIWARRVPVWTLAVAAIVAAGGIAAVAASGNSKVDDVSSERDAARTATQAAEATIEDLRATITGLETDLTEAREETSDALDRAAAAEAERDEYAASSEEADARRDEAEAIAQQAKADLDAILLRFDSDIRSAITNAQNQAGTAVCAAAEAEGFSGKQQPSHIDQLLEPVIGDLPEVVLAGRTWNDLLDKPALRATLDECFTRGAYRGVLDGPHGDGFHTVGLEISAGRWRSTGTGGSCYWAITPDGNPDRIINNHFGNAGGTVTLQNGQEFETDGCGIWDKVG